MRSHSLYCPLQGGRKLPCVPRVPTIWELACAPQPKGWAEILSILPCTFLPRHLTLMDRSSSPSATITLMGGSLGLFS